MALIITFLLGIGNFALHKAVLESGHPLYARLSLHDRTMAGRFSMGVEFVVLVAALVLAGKGLPWALIGYLCYSLLNAVSAWLITGGRL